jgi:hypothetical protein
MVKFVDRVKMNLTTTGTGTVTFGSVVSGFQSLSDASVVDADVVRYTIESGTNYESGTGTIGLTGSTYTMARSPSSSSESDNSAINLGSGAVCFLTMLAEDVVQVLADLDNVASTAPAGGQTLSWDAGTSSWSPASPSGGITSVGNYAGLPASPSETDLAWVQDTKSLYIYDGVEWDKVATGNQVAPRYTTAPPATLSLASDGSTTSDIVTVAVDDMGYPVRYAWDAFSGSNVYGPSALPPQLTAVSVNQNGTYTLTPSGSSSNAGDVSFRAQASDGVATVVGVTILTLQFSDNFTVSSLSRNGDTLSASSTGLFDATTNGGFISASGFLVGDVLKTGKYYFEAKYTQSHTLTNSGLYTGFIDAVRGANNDTGYSTSPGGNVAVWFTQDGSVGHNGPYDVEAGFSNSSNWTSGVCTTGNSVTTADILMYAYDTTAKKAWFGINNSWSLFTGNPVTGSGMPMSDITGAVRFFVAYNNVSGSIDLQIQTGDGGSPTYSAPTGFENY